MYLEKLEIQGFKSFAQKTTLKFELPNEDKGKGITCVVGPNGSGKSNIADSVRWVMGEQSLRVLRGKKSQDVIFAGSDKKTRLGMAEVSLYLNNEDHSMPVDYQEVVITRRIYRDGEGEYFINKNRVRLSDILLLLAKSNIGQRTYSVIGQGTIESFLFASARQRKDFFDEAAGVRQFQIKKEQALNKLGHTGENLNQAEMLIQEIEPRLRSLRRQVKRLEKREEIEQKLIEYQIQYYGRRYQEIKESEGQESKKVKEAESEYQRAKNKLAEIQNLMEKEGEETSRSQIFTKLQADLTRLFEVRNGLLKEQSLILGQRDLERRKQGEGDLVWLEKRRDDLRREINKNETDRLNLKESYERKKKTLEEKTKKQGAVIYEFKDLEKKLKEAKEKIQYPPELSRLRTEIERISQQQEDFIGILERIKSLEELKEARDKAYHIRENLRGFLKKLEVIPSVIDQSYVEKIQYKITDFLQTKDTLVNELNDLRVVLRIREEKDKFLEKEIENDKNELARMERELKISQADLKEEERYKLIEEENQKIMAKLKEVDEELKKIRGKIDVFNEEEERKKKSLIEKQKEFQKYQIKFNEAGSRLNDLKVSMARLETRREDVEKEMKVELVAEIYEKITELNKEYSSEFSNEHLQERIQHFKNQLELIGGIEPETVAEYEETEKRYGFLTSQSEDLKKAINSLEEVIKELEETIKETFGESFKKINNEFGKYFRALFNGGKAELVLQKDYEETAEEMEAKEGLEPTEESLQKEEDVSYQKKPHGEKVVTGIEIKASPPGKRLGSMNMLSGGERALTSIALICAILTNSPSPFVVLDEVDAALDEANSERFSAILERLSHRTQFITITHNRATMRRANILYGVTMGDDGVSKILSVKMEEAEKIRKL